MSATKQSLEQVVGSLAFPLNDWITKDRKKLAYVRIHEVPDGPVKDTLYLLAALAFDMQRRLGYLFAAVEAYGPQGDPELARRVWCEAKELEEAEARQDYKRLAEQLEAMACDLCREIEPRWTRIMQQVVGQDPDCPEPKRTGCR